MRAPEAPAGAVTTVFVSGQEPSPATGGEQASRTRPGREERVHCTATAPVPPPTRAPIS